MTQQKKNDNTTGTTGTQPNQGNVGKGTTGQKGTQGSGSQGYQGGAQAGGKTSPAGGPETFESDQTNQGKGNQQRTSQGASQSGRGDPYPPVNPDRPMMAGGQQGGSQAGQVTQGSQGKQSGGQIGSQDLQGSKAQGGNFGASGGFGGSQAGAGKTAGIGGATGGLEEEEE